MENLENSVINNEILLIVSKNSFGHSKFNKERFIQNFLDKIDSNSYHLVDIVDIENIEKLKDYKDKKSIIVIGYIGMPIDKIVCTDFKILLFFSPVQNIFQFKNMQELVEINEIKYPYRYIKVINKKDPFNIINSYDYILILECLNYLFHPYIFNKYFNLFSSFEILTSDRHSHALNIDMLNIFEKDIELLISEKKLTARLAIAIYKVCTLRFYDNNTTVGTFFSKKLGIKSKTSKQYRSQILKVYDLEKLPI